MVETTKLPLNLALKVAKELKDKHGIDHWGSGLLNRNFTAEELQKITKLKLQNPVSGSCEGLDLLPNLRMLSIETEGTNEFIQSSNIASISNKDFSMIEKCKNLKRLEIINQTNISEIDLSGMPNLEGVEISKNRELESIIGIDNLSNLDSLTCYGNKSLQEIEGLSKAITKNEDLQNLNLDVLLFPKVIDYRPNGTYNQEAVDKMDQIKANYGEVNWLESFSGFGKIKINHHQMVKMHNKACSILAENVPQNAGTCDTVVAVERYLAENVVYDTESLKHGHTKTTKMDNGMRLVDGSKGGANGAFNCIMENSCVCEGYTRGEQYLLSLRGIKTHNVSCIAGADRIGMADSKKEDDQFTIYNLPDDGYHSIVRIDDYYNLYSDPCWNAGHYQKGDKSMPYSLLTKGEVSKTHTLSFEEKNIVNNHLSIGRKNIAESLEHNTLFRNKKTSEISQQRKETTPQIRGQILKRGGKSYD